MTIKGVIEVIGQIEAKPIFKPTSIIWVHPVIFSGPTGLRHQIDPALPSQMPFANIGGSVSGSTERISNSAMLRMEDISMVRYITAGWILAGNQTGPKGNTDWVVAVSVGTANPFSRQAIYIGCLNIGV